ncbi:glycosyl hydrolase [Flavobacterium sp. N3904]|uniref:glycosyl hydrolase n=1 Tax=Flavobacterium sp. N3904 TaxID=2986835 RepID=UPI002224BF15|nr:glycosyl hydrolase [Flavobacterium sp. N3904]
MIKQSHYIKTLLFSFLMLLSFYVSAQPLVNSNATPEAKKLKAFLDDNYGKKIISGQAFESVGENWLTRISDASHGKQPAILSLDFMNSMPWRVANGAKPDETTELGIDWVKNKGGILEMHWHWDAPKNSNFSTWQAFYTKNTTFDLEYALNNPTSEDYQLLIRDIDIVAGKLLRLQSEGIAVIWRPLHEAEGKWFWWGAKTGTACTQLYRLLYDRLVKHHGINNLIWVWNSYGTTKENWYPGDDVVDIIAWDYPDYNQSSGSWSQYQQLFGSKGKLFALAEDGKLIDPDILAQQPWLYFATWAYMINDPSQQNGKNTAEWIYRVYNDPRVITLDDLQSGPKAYIDAPAIVFDNDGNGKEVVAFSASRSNSPDSQIISYSWTENGVEKATGVEAQIELGLGTHEILLTVTTNTLQIKTARFTVNVKRKSLSLNKPFTVSSTEANLGNTAANAVDGNLATRWSSQYADPQWYQIDLGQIYNIEQVVLVWEAASAKSYTIEVSDDGLNWRMLATKSNMPAGERTDQLSGLSGSGKYIRFNGIERTTTWGYSIFEFEVYGAAPDALNTVDLSKLKLSSTIVNRNESLELFCASEFLPLTYDVFNSAGMLIQRGTISEVKSYILFHNKIAKGVYFITLHNENFKEVLKFITN